MKVYARILDELMKVSYVDTLLISLNRATAEDLVQDERRCPRPPIPRQPSRPQAPQRAL